MSKKRACGFLYAAYLIVATLVLLEIAVRIWGYSERYIYDPIYMPFQRGATIPFIHKPLLENVRARSGTWFSTDSLGLRSATTHESIRRESVGEFRIAIIGNSATFGQGVRTEETFCFLMAQKLREEVGIAVRTFNFGVSGYSVKEMAATVQHRVFDIDPNLIMVCISIDDFDTTRCGGVDQWGYNVSYRLSQDVDKNSLLKRALRPIHLAYIIRDIKYSIGQTNGASMVSPEALSVIVPSSYYYVQRMRMIAGRKGVPFILVTLPTSGWTGVQFTETVTRCKADSIDVLDLSQLGRDIPSTQFNVEKYDSHPSGLVHNRIAEKIVAHLIEGRPSLTSFVHND